MIAATKSNSRPLADRISQGIGDEKADLVIKDATVFHLVTGEMVRGDIAICGDRIVGTCGTYDGAREIDGRGLTAVPGFIDSHVHVESSMVTPHEFDRLVLPHGTTTAVCDPHELANVSGTDAIDYFLEASSRLCMDLFTNISSCVPASPFETPGKAITPDQITRYTDHPRVLGLAEFMNVPGVLGRDPECLAKIEAFESRVDGHSPTLSGRDLNGYLAAGVRNCHECTFESEAREKLRKGVHLMIREGSVAHDLKALLPILTIANSAFLGFCTDDRTPPDVAAEGHIDGIIARAIDGGANPLAVYRAASISAARHFRLFDRGLIAPGYKADIVLLSDLRGCKVEKVVKSGIVVDEALFAARPPAPSADFCLDSIHLRKVAADDFTVRSTKASSPVIGVIPLSIATRRIDMELPVANGVKCADPANDVAKIAVLERHGHNGNIGRGFVKGFGLKHGAIASSVGHDAHNVCVVGMDDGSMAAAVNALRESGGGFAVAKDGVATDVLPLPLGGLMSDRPHEEVAAALDRIVKAAQALGTPLESPFHQLAFLPLSVIPAMRITDIGLFDASAFQFVEP